ncbi:integrase [Streptomyces griseoflavus Tu4000]|uniref:Integrase n=1 Tax=Streptomyces griseoflavus Tu4000 TaxID=467200 RepID=D9XMU6_9ACTN|nr:integrase [Streptomyces griseoflavus Tu4000]
MSRLTSTQVCQHQSCGPSSSALRGTTWCTNTSSKEGSARQGTPAVPWLMPSLRSRPPWYAPAQRMPIRGYCGVPCTRGHSTRKLGSAWQAPAVSEEVDPAAVPNPAQVLRLLEAVARQRGRGPHLEAFFGCMYFAAMRPAEVIHLRIEQCHLPKTGWGMLNLSGGVVTSGKGWTDDGEVHEVHSLKRRAASATRPVPIPPQFVRMLRAHVNRFDVAPDGRLFRNQAGNYVDAAAYGITWARAREYALTRTERTSRLAKRPYDLRHAGISFWLYSGVDPAECARRAGQSIEVLFRHYAKFLDGLREQANRLIEQSMNEWQRVSQGDVPDG